VRRTVPPSAEIEEQIDRLLAVRVGEKPRESLSELAKLGARLIIQRAVEDEFDAWLGRARYERRTAYQRGLRNYESGLRNGFRPRRVQTLEGELQVEIPQVREAAEPLASKLFRCSTKVLRTEPLMEHAESAERRKVSSLAANSRNGRNSRSPSLCASELGGHSSVITATSSRRRDARREAWTWGGHSRNDPARGCSSWTRIATLAASITTSNSGSSAAFPPKRTYFVWSVTPGLRSRNAIRPIRPLGLAVMRQSARSRGPRRR
jgi:hypothetical protein